MVVNKKKTLNKKAIKANSRVVRRSVRAAEEVEDEVVDEGEGEVAVAPEASDLLFEAEDVAELVAEITGKEVSVTAEEDVVTFEVGDDEFVVEAEGDEEILEATKKPLKGKSRVTASTRRPAARPAVRRPLRDRK